MKHLRNPNAPQSLFRSLPHTILAAQHLVAYRNSYSSRVVCVRCLCRCPPKVSPAVCCAVKGVARWLGR